MTIASLVDRLIELGGKAWLDHDGLICLNWPLADEEACSIVRQLKRRREATRRYLADRECRETACTHRDPVWLGLRWTQPACAVCEGAGCASCCGYGIALN
jgi:hypothetical protein